MRFHPAGTPGRHHPCETQRRRQSGRAKEGRDDVTDTYAFDVYFDYG